MTYSRLFFACSLLLGAIGNVSQVAASTPTSDATITIGTSDPFFLSKNGKKRVQLQAATADQPAVVTYDENGNLSTFLDANEGFVKANSLILQPLGKWDSTSTTFLQPSKEKSDAYNLSVGDSQVHRFMVSPSQEVPDFYVLQLRDKNNDVGVTIRDDGYVRASNLIIRGSKKSSLSDTFIESFHVKSENNETTLTMRDNTGERGEPTIVATATTGEIVSRRNALKDAANNVRIVLDSKDTATLVLNRVEENPAAGDGDPNAPKTYTTIETIHADGNTGSLAARSVLVRDSDKAVRISATTDAQKNAVLALTDAKSHEGFVASTHNDGTTVLKLNSIVKTGDETQPTYTVKPALEATSDQAGNGTFVIYRAEDNTPSITADGKTGVLVAKQTTTEKSLVTDGTGKHKVDITASDDNVIMSFTRVKKNEAGDEVRDDTGQPITETSISADANDGSMRVDKTNGDDMKSVVNVEFLKSKIPSNMGNVINNYGDQITNINHRLNRYDAQIQRVSKIAESGTAIAMAAGTVPQIIYPGKTMIGAAASAFLNTQAIAIGVSSMSDDGSRILRANFSGSTAGHFGASVGLGWVLY